ncbi:DUF4652 domain-containing protein [Bacillus sp. SCS-151]|uniref:DUF4652 domain-containing protein n=1 Tax=Nanhaiella sioensis TaxID=3115293 RepID=UPI003978B0FC
MYQLEYDETRNEILQIDPDGKKTVITDDSPSIPIISPNGKKAVYISPLEWERLGSLHLYDLENGTIANIIEPDIDQNIPKYALWIDDDNIAVIIGFGDGTVAVGGNVFIYNITDHILKQITDYSKEIQITNIKMINETLSLKGIKYIDDIFAEFKEFEDTISLNEFAL